MMVESDKGVLQMGLQCCSFILESTRGHRRTEEPVVFTQVKYNLVREENGIREESLAAALISISYSSTTKVIVVTLGFDCQ